MKDHKLKLYKSYKEFYKNEGKVKEIDMENAEIEIHKERDDEYGFYIRVKADGDKGKYEIWTDTLKEYELWIDFIKHNINTTQK